MPTDSGEQTTYTAGAVILAIDALARGTAGSDIMRGSSTLAPSRARPGLRLRRLGHA